MFDWSKYNQIMSTIKYSYALLYQGQK